MMDGGSMSKSAERSSSLATTGPTLSACPEGLNHEVHYPASYPGIASRERNKSSVPRA
jgi:hypothetical protein